MKISISCALVLLATTPVLAGGLVLPVRGVRTLERAGAFIAGADDADALWMNPAGLAHVHGDGKKALLFDVAYVFQDVAYAQVDTAGSAIPLATNQQPGRTPIPTLAAALALGDALTIAGGVTAPYSGLHRYAPGGPQRFSSVSSAQSSDVLVTVGVAYRVSDALRVGATLQNLVSTMRSVMVVSSCPDESSCASDDRSFDSVMTLEQTDYVSPSGSVGVQLDLIPELTLGLAVQAPGRVASSGTLSLALPSAPLFNGARVVGTEASVGYSLPPIVRAGIEARPSPSMRIEAAVGIELWSVHDDVTIQPHDIRVENVQGINAYPMRTMTIPRDYGTSIAPALAVEYHGSQMMLGAGVSYETAAAPPSLVSVQNVDGDKILVGIGGGYAAEGWQIGAAAGYVSVADVDVSLAEARVPQLQPLRDQPTPIAVNAGRYQTSYIVAGIRAARRF